MSSINKMIENIKRVHPDFVLCYKVGNFYQSYGKDAYIISYIFGYRIKYVKQNIPSVGFPITTMAKVQAILEQKKINYMFLDPRNNYDVDIKDDNKNLNQYKIILEKAINYIRVQKRIDRYI